MIVLPSDLPGLSISCFVKSEHVIYQLVDQLNSYGSPLHILEQAHRSDIIVQRASRSGKHSQISFPYSLVLSSKNIDRLSLFTYVECSSSF